MNHLFLAVICIRNAKIFCGKIRWNQKIALINIPICYNKRRSRQLSFLSVSIGIFFVPVKYNLFLTICKSKLTGLAGIGSFYFRPVFDDRDIIGQHIHFLPLDTRCFSKRYGFSFVSKRKLFSGVLIVFTAIADRKGSSPHGGRKKHTSDEDSTCGP